MDKVRSLGERYASETGDIVRKPSLSPGVWYLKGPSNISVHAHRRQPGLWQQNKLITDYWGEKGSTLKITSEKLF